MQIRTRSPRVDCPGSTHCVPPMVMTERPRTVFASVNIEFARRRLPVLENGCEPVANGRSTLDGYSGGRGDQHADTPVDRLGSNVDRDDRVRAMGVVDGVSPPASTYGLQVSGEPAPRCLGLAAAANSSSIQPWPTQATARPPERRSSVARRLARTTGAWNRALRMKVPRRMRVARAATQVRDSIGSSTTL